MLGGIEQSRARYVFTSSDPSVIRVYAGGDSIVAEDRGTATLVVTLVGSTIGNNRVNPSSRTADTIVVASAALTNQVTPTTVSFQSISARQTLLAQSIGRNDRVIVGTDIVWRSDNPAVATVAAVDDNTSEVVAVGNGSTIVWAVFGGVDSTSTTVTVTQQLKRYLLTTAAAPTMRSINETLQVSARAVDSLGNTINTATGAPVPPAPNFVSDNPGRVEIDAVTGMMTARGNTAETPVKITATIGGTTRSDTLQATVLQLAASLMIQGADTIRLLSIGDSRDNISVLAPDALGTQIPNANIRWESADASRVVATGNALGKVTAENTGTVVVRARADQQVDSVIVIVTNDPAIVTLAPKPLALRSLDETQTMTATVTNTAGTPLPGVTVTWISRDSSIVQPQAAPGQMLARAVGETRVVAMASNGRADSTTVRVTNAPDTVNIIPPTLSLPSVGDTDGTFAVDLKNARGVALPRDAANWSSHDVTIARALAGVITAVGPGTTWIVAVSPENAARRDSILVTVTNDAASVTVSPDPAATLTAIGATRSFSAVVRNASGNVVSTPVTWSVPVGAAFVSIDPVSGVATAVSNGTATIRATAGSMTDDVSLTVAQAIAPSRSSISAAAATLVADGAATTTVTLRLRDANDVDIATGGATVTLGLSPAIATLSAVTDNGNGTYTATLTAGTTTGAVTITGTVNGQSITNTGSLTFTSGPVSQYVVTVAPTLQPVAGSAVTVSARAADVNGNAVAQAGNIVTWSSTGGGSFNAPTSTTNASGVATITFTTSASAAQHTVTATTGATTGTSAAITTQPGAASQYGVTPSSSTPVAGSQIVISAQLRDANGNPVASAGQTVSWTKSDPNGVFSAPSTVTNASGVATVTLTTHTVSNTSTTVMATTGAVAGTSIAITTVAGASTQLTVTQAPSASAQSGVPFATQPVLQLHDANGNPVSQANVSVTATITAGGGTLSGVTLIQTNASGVATFTDLAISGANGGRTITFSTSGVSSATAGVTLGAGGASQMALVAGNGQSAQAGTSVATAPSVVVRDASNNPVAGVNVTFAITGGAGTTSPPSGSTVATDASGIAALTSWTLGNSAGTNTLTASVAGLTGSPVTFTATGTAGTATQMTTSVGAQTATVNTPVAIDPWVQVLDANNNPIAGVSVTFAVTSGAGSISSPTGNTVVTNASGMAALSSWTLGTSAGANTLTATSAGLPTVTFTATGTAGAATHVTVNGGNGQSAIVGTAVATAPSVVVRDAHNNPVAATNVTFTTTAGGGTTAPASPATIATNASGVAALATWTLGTTAGQNSISASAPGLIGTPVTFTATGTPAVVNAGTSSVLRTGSNNVPANGASTSEITVTLRDQHGNPVPGKTVTLSRTGTTSIISAPAGNVSTVVGEVRFIVTNTTIETVTYSATANDPAAIALGNVSVTFVAGATFMIATTGTTQNAVIGTNVASPPTVLVRDEANNPVAGVNVTFTLTANGGGGSISPASPATIVTDAAGLATLTSWTLGPVAGTNNNAVTATASGVLGSPITFTASGENPDPDLTAVTPGVGVQGQTMTTVLTGTGFIPTSTVSFNSPSTGVTVTSLVVNSSTQITLGIAISPTAATGTRFVRVSNPGPGGGSSSDRLLTVNVPSVPTLGSLAPASGSRAQTLNVVFTGTGFASGVTTVNVPAGFTVNSVTVNSGTQLTANITVGAATAFGAHNFSVTNTPAGGTSGTQVFTVDFPAPTLTSIAPSTGERLQTLNVVFTGTDFIAGVSSVNTGAGITVNSTTVDSPTQITANITITAAAATGGYSFSVTNAAPGGGTSATQTFTVTNPAPTLTAIAPITGERLQTLDVVFTGAGFVSGASTVNLGPNITLNSVTVNSATQLTANITITGTASTGARNFSVTNAAPGGGTSSVQSFTVTNPAPSLSAVSPASGVQGQQMLDLVLTGTGFVAGSVVTFTPNTGITINSTTANSGTQLTVNITIAAGATPGAVDVSVTNAAPGGGTTGAQTFSINAPAAPTLTAIAPAAGDRLQTLNVVFTGTGFANGVTSVIVPAGFTVNSTTVNSPTQLTANLTIAETAALGANSFTVTNTPAGGTSAAQTFTVSNPAPTITGVVPNPVNGALLGTTVGTMRLTGSGYIDGVTTVEFVQADVTINGGFVVDAQNQITLSNVQFPITLGTTTRTVRVTNPGRAAATFIVTVNP